MKQHLLYNKKDLREIKTVGSKKNNKILYKTKRFLLETIKKKFKSERKTKNFLEY